MKKLSQNEDYKAVLDQLASIRDTDDYSSVNIDYIQKKLHSNDERIRAAAALTATGCIFEKSIIDQMIEILQMDPVSAVRLAAIQPLGVVINEGVMRDFENETGSDTNIEYLEEWEDIQAQSLREDYLVVKNVLFSLLVDEFEDIEIRERCLSAISDLGFLEQVKEWIRDFIESENVSSKIIALRAMSKYPSFWIEELAQFLSITEPKELILEAISSCYSSDSLYLSNKVELLLQSDDPEVLSYSLLTLANLNKSSHLSEIFQKFSLHQNEKVREAAKDALNQFTRLNFEGFMEDKLGFEE